MLGVDAADRDDFKRWSDLTAMRLNPLLPGDQRALMAEAMRELDAYLERTIAERRSHPRDDLISALNAVEEAGDQLNDGEIVTMCALLLAAGNVTTTDLIGNGVWTLLRHPAQLRKLRADPSLIKNAVEEILRFESPVVQAARIPMDDVEIGGCPIRRGESVLLWRPRIAIRTRVRSPIASISPDRTSVTTRSAAARTSAWARRSRGSKRSSRSRRSCSASRTCAWPPSRSNGARSPRSEAWRSSAC
jgi:cytochrome P450